MIWFGDTRVTNTPVRAADKRRVECSLAHEQSGVGGGPVLELFEGEASRESGNVTWESFVHGVEGRGHERVPPLPAVCGRRGREAYYYY